MLKLEDKKDYYILSRLFFKFYYDLFDCNQIIQVKYIKEYKEIEINSVALLDEDPKKLKRNNDYISQGEELTAIKE